jgi:translation initiation factor IF-3
LVDETGKQLGVLPTREALRIAQERDLDLVEVASAAKPPVCRVLDYGKFLYEKTKKERKARKSQRLVDIKEIWLHPKTAAHDVEFKCRRVREFLADGAKVRVRVRFRGREKANPKPGQDLLERVLKSLTDAAVIEQAPTVEEGASSVYVLLAPKVSADRPHEAAPDEAAAPVLTQA